MRRVLSAMVFAALSGALLFASDYPLHLWPLQVFALLPFLLALERLCRSARSALLCGLSLGLAYTVPLLAVLEFPLLMGGGLAFYQSLLWSLIALGIYWLRQWPSPLGPLGAGAVVAIVEWIDSAALPVWGTAQSFVRVWSAAPIAVQVVAAAGVTGLAFLLVSGQALLGRLLWGTRRPSSLLALGLLLGLAAGWCGWSFTRPAQGSLRVAALGWTSADLRARDALSAVRLFDRLYQPLVEQAAAQGAELIASPEAAFALGPHDKRNILRRAAELARRLGRSLLIGYLDRQDRTNHARLILPDGRTGGDYLKTHLIPLLEPGQAGKGTLLLGELPGGAPPRSPVRVGAMICQDDNFTDLARAYGRAGVQLVVVPTNDWLQVKDYHLENAIFRAVENRYAVLRAASNGVSALISPRGEVLARRDPFREGAGLLVGQLPLGGGPTLYSRLGDGPPAISLLLLAGGWLWQRKRSRSRKRLA